MISQKRCQVILNNECSLFQYLQTLGRYWPENESELKIGPFTVTKSDDENMDNIEIQQLQIQYESKVNYMYLFDLFDLIVEHFS